MEKNIKELQEWIKTRNKNGLPELKAISDVDLYMDQVLSYLDEILEPYSVDDQKLITSFMVNNYVKARIIKKPKLRKYNKNQIANLIAISLLKQVSSMSTLTVLLNSFDEDKNQNKFYEKFRVYQESSVEEVVKIALPSIDNLVKKYKSIKKEKAPKQTKKKTDTKSKSNEKKITERQKLDKKAVDDLIEMALKFLIQAEVYKFFADRMLSEVAYLTFGDETLLNESRTEVKFDKKKTKQEVTRVKNLNQSKIRKERIAESKKRREEEKKALEKKLAEVKKQQNQETTDKTNKVLKVEKTELNTDIDTTEKKDIQS